MNNRKPLSHASAQHLMLCLALSCVCFLTSCEEDNFFTHRIEYKGENKESDMVVTARLEAGKTPRIIVNTCYFIADSTAKEYASGNIEFNGYIDEWSTYGVKRGLIKDAKVEMQINNEPWQQLTGAVDTFRYIDRYYSLITEEGFSYTSNHVFQPGEKVSLRVSHRDFKKTATVSQIIPDYPHAIITPKGIEGAAMNFQVDLPPYKGNETDLLQFIVTTYSTDSLKLPNSAYYNSNADYNSTSDSIHVRTMRDCYVFSKEIGFSRFDNTNCQLSHDYWGSERAGLFHEANHSSATLSLPIIAFYPDYVHREGEQYYESLTTDSIVLEVNIVSRDTYLQMASMVLGDYVYNDPIDPWYIYDDSDYNDFADILEEIEMIFNELGKMEGVQAFSNVKGGIGYATASAKQRFVYLPTRQ